MSLSSLTISSIVFLVLYFTLLLVLIAGYLTKRIKLRSRYTLVLFHVTLRVAAQGVGIGFGVKGFEESGLLIGYLILAAEGYFTLVLCTARFLISWHNHNFQSKDSWLEPRRDDSQKWYQGLAKSFTLKHPMGLIHWLLISANAIIIAGGGQLTGDSDSSDVEANWDSNPGIQTAKIMRGVGQAIFLAVNLALFGCILYTIKQAKKEDSRRPFYAHPTLLILVLIWPFLFVRGVYGVLQAVITEFNYYYPGNYTDNGFKDRFVVEETLLATLMEWTSCALLMVTWYTSRNDPKSEKRREKEYKLEEMESEERQDA